jgi:serine/threonine protein phosphatase PrpC
MVEAFRATEEGFLNHALKTQLQDGTVAVCALLAGETLIVGNVGDSRCVLSREGVAHRLSVDHKPDSAEEKKRVLDHGGSVVFSGCWRVSHPVLPVRLACSRSIGDKRFKDVQVISALPHVCSLALSNSDHFLILASDGIWDVLSDQVAVDIVSRALALYQLDHAGMPPHALVKGAVAAAARCLVDEACKSGSDDNCTAVVVSLRWS